MISRLVILFPINRKGAGEMAQLVCAHCNKTRQLHYISSATDAKKPDLIYGVLTCRNCEQKTIFGMNNDAISFYPGKAAYGALTDNTPQDVRDIFVDAELCFYGMGFRGAVAVSRACVEAGLSHMGIDEGTLEQRIDEAKKKSVLTETQYMLAHGSRLAGNKALHRAPTVAPSDVPSVLSAVISIINYLFG